MSIPISFVIVVAVVVTTVLSTSITAFVPITVVPITIIPSSSSSSSGHYRTTIERHPSITFGITKTTTTTTISTTTTARNLFGRMWGEKSKFKSKSEQKEKDLYNEIVGRSAAYLDVGLEDHSSINDDDDDDDDDDDGEKKEDYDIRVEDKNEDEDEDDEEEEETEAEAELESPPQPTTTFRNSASSFSKFMKVWRRNDYELGIGSIINDGIFTGINSNNQNDYIENDDNGSSTVEWDVYVDQSKSSKKKAPSPHSTHSSHYHPLTW